VILCGNCKQYHETVERVRTCHNVQAPRPIDNEPVHAYVPKTNDVNNATERQCSFLAKLISERPNWASTHSLSASVISGLTKKQASDFIGMALRVDKEVGAKKKAGNDYPDKAKRGDVHVLDGTYYRIHVGQRSGKPYACRALVTATAEWAGDGSLVQAGQVSWELARGMLFRLSENTKATPSQAAKFGQLVGRCCFCSKAIDTPESTQAGYGPVCASRYGLPWGKVS
jgi:hypothetical protein